MSLGHRDFGFFYLAFLKIIRVFRDTKRYISHYFPFLNLKYIASAISFITRS